MPRLLIARAEDAAEGIRRFELRHPDDAPLPPFTAGAHVHVVTPAGQPRRYSLCNDPAERDRYVIAVKRDPAGRGGSVAMADQAREGSLLEVSEPRNAFPLVEKAPGHLLIAGGIGITPLMAMARRLNTLGARYRLYYCTRTPAQAAFLDELRGEAFRGKVVVHHDGGDPARALDLWPLLEKPTRDHVYCCGPRPLLEAVRDMSGHWPATAIHFESFLDAGASARPDDHSFTVVLARSGDEIVVPPGISILGAMRAHGRDAPSSCESGTCGTCRTALLGGVADHRDLVLTEEERATQVMICVSRARGARLVIDR